MSFLICVKHHVMPTSSAHQSKFSGNLNRKKRDNIDSTYYKHLLMLRLLQSSHDQSILSTIRVATKLNPFSYGSSGNDNDKSFHGSSFF